MTRLKIEESFWSHARLERFCQLTGFSRRLAVGTLICFWHDSQEQGRRYGSAEEIREWCGITDYQDGQQLVKALVSCSYITALTEGFFEIHGNERQFNW